MKFQPLRDILVIRRTATATMTEGGIDLSASSREAPNEGVVLAAGPGKHIETGELIPMSISVGDTILFGAQVGFESCIEGETVLMMREEDAMGILRSA